MFTGIVQGKATVNALKKHDKDNFLSLEMQFPDGALNNVAQGASIAINGVCLTVTNFNISESTANFDVINETLIKTNLGRLSQGSETNFERAAKLGDEIGGHQMSGHIWTNVKILRLNKSDANLELVFDKPDNIKDYVLEKGYIGLNGCSLTIAKVTEQDFSVCLIPETLEVTVFGSAKAGDLVNLEIDPQTQTIVDTVKSYLSANKEDS